MVQPFRLLLFVWAPREERRAASLGVGWFHKGPHLMILVPNPEILKGLSTDPEDPVYVMRKGTPYVHIMVKISEDE